MHHHARRFHLRAMIWSICLLLTSLLSATASGQSATSPKADAPAERPKKISLDDCELTEAVKEESRKNLGALRACQREKEQLAAARDVFDVERQEERRKAQVERDKRIKLELERAARWSPWKAAALGACGASLLMAGVSAALKLDVVGLIIEGVSAAASCSAALLL